MSSSLFTELDSQRLADALRAARLPFSQVTMTKRLTGVHGLGWQSTISALERAQRTPTLAQMLAIEQAGEKPAGFVLRAAGVLPEVDTRWAIGTDPKLSSAARAGLLAAYDAMIAAPIEEVER
jgi:transcriptional regulator with XRE-family HTH domain